MNPLLTLMHDTANSTCLIDAALSNLDNRLKHLGVEDTIIKDKLELIKRRSKKIDQDLDNYYNKTKENK